MTKIPVVVSEPDDPIRHDLSGSPRRVSNRKSSGKKLVIEEVRDPIIAKKDDRVRTQGFGGGLGESGPRRSETRLKGAGLWLGTFDTTEVTRDAYVEKKLEFEAKAMAD